jgi:hypothetical protein
LIDVTFKGVTQSLPASQIINQIIADTPNADASLESYKLGNPATDSTSPDIVVTLQPGYIWVGNVLNKHKNGEHGGFSDDDTHVALILGGGAIGSKFQGTTQTGQVETVQIAVTTLDALGLNPNDLTGVHTEHTKALPGTGIPLFKKKSASVPGHSIGRTPSSAGSNPLSDLSGSIVGMITGGEHASPINHGDNAPSMIGRMQAIALGNVPVSVNGNAHTGSTGVSAFQAASRHVAAHDAAFGGHHSRSVLDAMFAEGF